MLPIVLLALNTGLRRSELLHLQWKDVDLNDKWITVVGASAKNAETRRLALNTEAAAILTGWLEQRQSIPEEEKQSRTTPVEDFVFPRRGGGRLKRIDAAWRGIVKLANFRFQDLRHHFASRLVQSGVDLNTVRELLGHADIAIVVRYAHLSPDRLATAVEKNRSVMSGYEPGGQGFEFLTGGSRGAGIQVGQVHLRSATSS